MNSKKIGSLTSSSFDFLSPSCDIINHSSLISDYAPWSTNLSPYNSFSCFDDDSSMPPCINSSSFQKPLEFAPSPFSSAEYSIDFPRSEKCEEVSYSWDNRVQLVDQSKEEWRDVNSKKRKFISVEADGRSSAGHILANPLLQNPNFQLQLTDVTSASLIPASGISGPIKTRIRWTTDLHEKFVECVNCLGGAEKATPKGILKLMDLGGLTIYHIKSHLQKYRLAKHMPSSSEGFCIR